jgi:excisionase family DNA binding protein
MGVNENKRRWPALSAGQTTTDEDGLRLQADRLYGFVEAASILGVSESTLRKKAAAGEVPHRKVFRQTKFSATDLLAVQEIRPAKASGSGTGRRRATATSR